MPALQQDRRQDMLKTAALLLSASLLCAPAHALADPLADIDSLILSNMHILGNWENDAPLAALAETPEPAAKPEQLAESPKQVFGLDGDRFKISVPEGWSAEAIHGGVRIKAPSRSPETSPAARSCASPARTPTAPASSPATATACGP